MLPAEATADLSCVTSQQLFCLISLVGTVVIASHTLYTRRQVKSAANTFQSIDTSNLKRSLRESRLPIQHGGPKSESEKRKVHGGLHSLVPPQPRISELVCGLLVAQIRRIYTESACSTTTTMVVSLLASGFCGPPLFNPIPSPASGR
jgi:hypothetical protein